MYILFRIYKYILEKKNINLKISAGNICAIGLLLDVDYDVIKEIFIRITNEYKSPIGIMS